MHIDDVENKEDYLLEESLTTRYPFFHFSAFEKTTGEMSQGAPNLRTPFFLMPELWKFVNKRRRRKR